MEGIYKFKDETSESMCYVADTDNTAIVFERTKSVWFYKNGEIYADILIKNYGKQPVELLYGVKCTILDKDGKLIAEENDFGMILKKIKPNDLIIWRFVWDKEKSHPELLFKEDQSLKLNYEALVGYQELQEV